MKVLVINEIIPEETNIAIVDMTQELYDKLKCCHGYTVNNEPVIREDAEQAVLAIGYAFSKKPENIDKDIVTTPTYIINDILRDTVIPKCQPRKEKFNHC